MIALPIWARLGAIAAAIAAIAWFTTEFTRLRGVERAAAACTAAITAGTEPTPACPQAT